MSGSGVSEDYPATGSVGMASCWVLRVLVQWVDVGFIPGALTAFRVEINGYRVFVDTLHTQAGVAPCPKTLSLRVSSAIPAVLLQFSAVCLRGGSPDGSLTSHT